MLSTLGIVMLAAVLSQQPASLTATPPVSSLVVAGSVGRGTTWDDEGSIGGGMSAGANLEWRFRPRLSAVFRVERLGHERHLANDLVETEGGTLFGTGEIKYRFGSSAAAPFVTGGYGLAHYSGTLTQRIGPAQTITRNSLSGTVVGGGGVDIPIGERLVLTPELRIFMCQPNDDVAPWSAIHAGVSVGWRF
jgi:hypothetical protein